MAKQPITVTRHPHAPQARTLDEVLQDKRVGDDIARTLDALAGVAAGLAARISDGPLGGPMATPTGENSDGDRQTALDVEADRAFAAAFEAAPVRWYASEERDGAQELNPSGTLAVAIDPLDGSSNIDVNVSIGTIFSIHAAAASAEESLLRPGVEQIAAGYVIYGPQTTLMLTLGDGVMKFILGRHSGAFRLVTDHLTVPVTASEFAINAANYRHWPAPIRAYIDDCLAGDEGPRGKNFNMRWVASLVAETHRIMIRGGIFLYPADRRPGYANGRLRLLYECAPIALLMEQAGGKATDGCDRILDLKPDSLHQRVPFVFGSADKVARVAAYHDLPPSEISPLFGQRGLFSG